jgi:hypothetical protein
MVAACRELLPVNRRLKAPMVRAVAVVLAAEFPI